MRRNLLLCCDKENLERYRIRVKRAFGNSVNLVNDIDKADLVYAIGAISPDMKKQMEEYQSKGIKTVHVNENLVNETGLALTKRILEHGLERGI